MSLLIARRICSPAERREASRRPSRSPASIARAPVPVPTERATIRRSGREPARRTGAGPRGSARPGGSARPRSKGAPRASTASVSSGRSRPRPAASATPRRPMRRRRRATPRRGSSPGGRRSADAQPRSARPRTGSARRRVSSARPRTGGTRAGAPATRPQPPPPSRRARRGARGSPRVAPARTPVGSGGIVADRATSSSTERRKLGGPCRVERAATASAVPGRARTTGATGRPWRSSAGHAPVVVERAARERAPAGRARPVRTQAVEDPVSVALQEDAPAPGAGGVLHLELRSVADVDVGEPGLVPDVGGPAKRSRGASAARPSSGGPGRSG